VTAWPLLALVLAAPAARPGGDSIRWESTFAAATEKAKAAGKPVMIDFWAEWCGYCHQLDRTTYRDPGVVRRSAAFVSVKVDTEGGAAGIDLASRYLVTSLPTILFVSPAGRPILRLSGYLPPGPFAMALAEVTRRALIVMAQETTLEKDPQNPEALTLLGLHTFTELSQVADEHGGRLSKSLFEDSRDLLSRAYRVDKDRPSIERKRVRSALGILHGFEGKFPQAEAMLKEALALSPADADMDARAYSKLGQVYMMQKKNDLARQTLRKLTERYPRSGEAQNARGQLQRLEKEPQ
jgi:thiol-disulfide isomerase/thioredoxin